MTQVSVEAPKANRLFNPNEKLTSNSEDVVTDAITPEKIPGEEEVDGDKIDNLNSNFIDTGENIAKKNKIKKIGTAAIIAGAVIVAGTVLLSTLGGNKNKEPKATNDNLPAGFTDTTSSESEINTSVEGTEVTLMTTADSTSTAMETTEETAANTEKTYDYTIGIENAVECYGFFELNADQQAEIKKLEAMAIKEYQALPQTEQLVFAQWFFENYKDRFDYLLKGAGIDLTYTENPTTPQEYSDNYTYITTMASTIIVTGLYNADGTYTGNKTDVLTGQKLMSLRDTSTEIHNEADNSYVNRFVDLVIAAKIDISVTGYKATEDGMILNMHQETTDNITVEPDAADGQRVFEPIDFNNIDDEKETIELCVLAIPLDDPRAVEVTPVK